jgi:uncharacterized protein YgbK (DUF1537 family)
MTEDENFLQEMQDYFRIEAQRHANLMATLEDVKAGQDAIMAAVETLIKEGRDALDVLKDTGAAGHSATMDDVVAGNKKILEAVTSANGELKSAIATTPMPGQAPGPQ